jgi:glycosyltransferase involved in cell wall biosynthesis
VTAATSTDRPAAASSASGAQATATRITFVISSLDAGGAERVLVTMADWWAEHGREVTVVHFGPPNERPFYGFAAHVHEVRLGLRQTSRDPLTATVRNLRRIRRLRATLRASRPDVVIAFLDRTNVLTLLATIGWRVPVIVEEHADPAQAGLGRIWSWLRGAAYRRAAAVVALTPTSLAYFPATIRRRGHVIPNPIAIEIPPRDVAARPDRGTVIGMGRLDREKGFDLLLRAFADVAPARPGWSLEIWGDGSERSALERLRVDLGLVDRCRLPGWTSRPFDVMRSADLFVLSSRQEGFGNVLVEAMAVGLPVVSFDCPSGPRTVVHDGEDGILVPAEDVEALRAAMTRLIDDPAERDRLAARAVDVRQRFAVPTIMDRWDRLIADVTAARAR